MKRKLKNILAMLLAVMLTSARLLPQHLPQAESQLPERSLSHRSPLRLTTKSILNGTALQMPPITKFITKRPAQASGHLLPQ